MRRPLVVSLVLTAGACAPVQNAPERLIARLESADPTDRERLVREAIEGHR